MLRLRDPRGERNFERKELVFRLTGGVEDVGGGLEDMTRSRYFLHPYNMAALMKQGGEEDLEGESRVTKEGYK
jgi:hypothetical protein